MIKFLLTFLFSCFIVYAQSNSIESKNNELIELQESIDNLQKELISVRSKTADSREVLKKLNRESHLLNKTLRNLEAQEKIQTNKIKLITDSINTVDSSITKLKSEYAKYVRWLFMYGRENKLELLFSSTSLNESLVKMKFFNLITDQNKNVKYELEQSKELLAQLAEKIERERDYKSGLIELNKKQAEKLNKSREERNTLIKKLQNNEANLANEIDEKRKAEILIKQIIARLEEEEREREQQRRENKLKGESTANLPTISYAEFENFSDLRGKLNWPVGSGTIVRNFGENKNRRLNTVTLNYGVDIQTRSETEVRSVAEGIVSAIEWIPGYGSVLIITHKGKYRTVYGHVTDITVYEGDKVNGGDVIGKVNSSLEGNVLHFEVWNERNYQNPEVWLVKK